MRHTNVLVLGDGTAKTMKCVTAPLQDFDQEPFVVPMQYAMFDAEPFHSPYHTLNAKKTHHGASEETTSDNLDGVMESPERW